MKDIQNQPGRLPLHYVDYVYLDSNHENKVTLSGIDYYIDDFHDKIEACWNIPVAPIFRESGYDATDPDAFINTGIKTPAIDANNLSEDPNDGMAYMLDHMPYNLDDPQSDMRLYEPFSNLSAQLISIGRGMQRAYALKRQIRIIKANLEYEYEDNLDRLITEDNKRDKQLLTNTVKREHCMSVQYPCLYAATRKFNELYEYAKDACAALEAEQNNTSRVISAYENAWKALGRYQSITS